MTISLIALALFTTQAETSLPGPDLEITEQREVAYEELIGGDAERALAALEAQLLQDPEDPALLINLAAAYAQLGREERAAAAYQAAIDSQTRYELELADGRWLDSRRVARMGLSELGTTVSVASR